MLTGLLLILKWIGIILLAILGLFLLLLGIILLSPIRYSLQGVYQENIRGSFSVRWLFGLVRVQGEKEATDDIKVQMRLFGRILGAKKKKKKRVKKSKAPAQNDILYSREKSTPTQQGELPKKDASKTDIPIKDIPKKNISAAEKKQEIKKEEWKKEEPEKKGIRIVKLADIEEEPPKKAPAWDGTEDTSFFLGTDNITNKKGQEIPPKKKTAKNSKLTRIQMIWKQFSEIEQKKEIVKATWRFLRHIAKGILPRDLRLKGTFGTGNPVTTGYLLAAAGILKGKFGDNLQIQGDFAKRTAQDIEVQAKGKIVIGYLALTGIRFALSKPIRPLFHIILKRRENHGKGI